MSFSQNKESLLKKTKKEVQMNCKKNKNQLTKQLSTKSLPPEILKEYLEVPARGFFNLSRLI